MILDFNPEIYLTTFERITYAWYGLSFLLILFLYFNIIKPYKILEKEEDKTKIPSDLGLIELSHLVNRKLNANTFSAYVIDLINRGLLKIEKLEDKEYIVKNDYGKNPSISDSATINLLLNLMGDGDRVTINDLKNFSKRKHNRNILLSEWNLWCRVMKKENYKHIFFEPKKNYGLVKFMSFIGILILLVNIIFKYYFILSYYTLIPIIALMLMFKNAYKRTYSSNIEYHKWLDYKNYINGITDEEETNNPEEIIVYATCLGLKDIESKITKHDYCDRITDALNTSIMKSILDGNRNVF